MWMILGNRGGEMHMYQEGQLKLDRRVKGRRGKGPLFELT
jgi:hypothetical protein